MQAAVQSEITHNAVQSKMEQFAITMKYRFTSGGKIFCNFGVMDKESMDEKNPPKKPKFRAYGVFSDNSCLISWGLMLLLTITYE